VIPCRFCGSTLEHCSLSNGCQSGCAGGEPIINPIGGVGTGGTTIDGTCGANNGNMICGNFPKGGCCSAYGFWYVNFSLWGINLRFGKFSCLVADIVSQWTD